MLNLRPFQVVLLAGSLMIFIGSISFLALYRPSPDDDIVRITEDIEIWGTLDKRPIEQQIQKITNDSDRFSQIKYTEMSEEMLVNEFVNALAEGRGPDLIVIAHDQLVELRPKLYAVSYEFLKQRDYFNTYIEGAEIFARNDGIYAIPLAVDPLVMYWNRNLFSNSNIPLPPATWETVRNDTVPRLTRTGGAFDILESALAFGEYRNVRNARAIISMLLLQSGSRMVVETKDSYQIALHQNELQNSGAIGMNPSAATLSFYTEFANPASSLYSWNRSLPEDYQQFLAGTLALYFGYGSELEQLEKANPNLNFDMAEVPQGANATIRRNFGTFYGFAIPRQAKSIAASYEVAQALANAENGQAIAEGLEMASVHRAVLAAGTIDPFQEVRNRGALIARGWLEPSKEATDQAFGAMVEDVTSGRLQVSAAINDAVERLRLAF